MYPLKSLKSDIKKHTQWVCVREATRHIKTNFNWIFKALQLVLILSCSKTEDTPCNQVSWYINTHCTWRHNPLHASGENNLQICHGISLEFLHNDEIPMKLQNIFTILNEQKGNNTMYCCLLIYLNHLSPLFFIACKELMKVLIILPPQHTQSNFRVDAHRDFSLHLANPTFLFY